MLYLKARDNLGFVGERDPFLLVRAQLPIWDATCAAKITMAPSDRRDKKPKDTSPWLWTAPRNSVCQSLYLSTHSCCCCCSLTCTPLTSSKTRPGLLSLCCVSCTVLCNDRVTKLPHQQRQKSEGKEPHEGLHFLLLRTRYQIWVYFILKKNIS